MSHFSLFTSFVAQWAILLRWRDASLPTLAKWLKDIMSCFKLETVRYKLQQLNGGFQKAGGVLFQKHSRLCKGSTFGCSLTTLHTIHLLSTSSKCDSALIRCPVHWKWHGRNYFIYFYMWIVVQVLIFFLLSPMYVILLFIPYKQEPKTIPNYKEEAEDFWYSKRPIKVPHW